MKVLKILTICCCLPLLMGACKGQKTGNTEGMKTLSGYFLKNTYDFTGDYACLVFADSTSLDNALGIGRTMSNTVDVPDFAGNVVAAVACPPVSHKAEIEIIGIEKSGETATISFEVKEDKSVALTYTMQPLVVFSFPKDDAISTVKFATNGEVVAEMPL